MLAHCRVQPIPCTQSYFTAIHVAIGEDNIFSVPDELAKVAGANKSIEEVRSWSNKQDVRRLEHDNFLYARLHGSMQNLLYILADSHLRSK